MTMQPQSSANTKQPAGMLRLFFRLVLLCITVFIGASAYVAWDAHRFLTSPGSLEPKDVVITIQPGATFDRVAWDLQKAGVISDVFRFRLLAHYHNALGSVRAGDFMVNTGWTPEQVLTQITKGQSILHRLSLREGLTWWETARSIEQQGFARFDDFKEVIHDPEFLQKHHIPFANAEGFLFPETYLLPKPKQPLTKEQAYEVASLMVRMFWKKTAAAWNQLPLKKGVVLEPATSRTPTEYEPQASVGAPAAVTTVTTNATAVSPESHNATLAAPLTNSTARSTNSTAVDSSMVSPTTAQVLPAPVPFPAWRKDGPQHPSHVDPAALRRLVILASLVEKETGVPHERAIVAGVYANRLRDGWKLECDPTIIYGVGEDFSGPIRQSQLKDSTNMYNTYIHHGLPPGPISSSGAASFLAAAHPARHRFFFFVATGAGDGAHIFSKNITEHNAAVRIYRQRMRDAQRSGS